ncbi:MAG: hypothetical protein QXK89_06635 [Candidatus Bathyarchaeia archaeon]
MERNSICVLCLTIHKERASAHLKKFLGFSTRILRLYLLSPLMIYATLGIYILLAIPPSLFDFSAYVDLLVEGISSSLAGIRQRIWQ